MRASDIVTALAIRLPTFVDDFTINNSVISLTRAGTTVTVTTGSVHNLVVGNAVNIVGAQTPIVINSITRSDGVAMLITDTRHDMTKTIAFPNVEIEGATESEFNGTFPLLNVLDRNTITFQVTDSGSIVASGSPLLLNGASILQTYNGLFPVAAVPSSTTFEYVIGDDTLFTPASGTIQVKKSPRISAAVSYERVLSAYTKNVPNNLWLFVVMGDGIAQKNRQIAVDSTDNLQKTQFFNQRITQTVSLYLFSPTSAQIAAREARDRSEELLRAICQSILLAKFDTLLECAFDNPLQFNEHGFHDYNTAFYVHRYTFEATLQMDSADTVGPDDDVAFRDICMTIGLNVGTETFDTLINLDKQIFVAAVFDPSTLPCLQLWLDADDASTITSSGGLVSQWDDKSGNSNNATQTTGSEQPTTGASINGLNAIDFDGSNDQMDLPSALFGIPSGDNTIFIVAVSDSSTNHQRLFTGRDGTTTGWTLIYNRQSSDTFGFVNSDAFSELVNSVGGVTTAHIIIATRASLNRTLSINGATPVSDILGFDITLTELILGGISNQVFDLDGRIGELLIYDRLLSASEILLVEMYLSTKWSITLG